MKFTGAYPKLYKKISALPLTFIVLYRMCVVYVYRSKSCETFAILVKLDILTYTYKGLGILHTRLHTPYYTYLFVHVPIRIQYKKIK